MFIGVSAPNVLHGQDVKTMNPGAIVFALANPDPEVDPDEAREYAAVVATGRSDYPNQINNVLAFPGVFRGLLDAQSTTITDAMLVAAARALADVVPAEELGPDYIIPSVFHPDVASGVAAAVRDAAAPSQPAARPRESAGSRPERATATPTLQHDGYMDHMGSDPKAGRLLVATPLLGDPNFRRTVVLIVEHEDVQGTLGVVLNRPTTIGVDQVLEQWTELATEPSVVFRGGPVAPNSALALAMIPGKDEPVGWRALDGAPALARLGLLDLDTPPRLLAPAITSLRVYAGYAGWSPGQLEAEIDEGAWYVLTAQPGDVFAADPDRLWRQVLRRQEGDLAFLATYPDDPTLNLVQARQNQVIPNGVGVSSRHVPSEACGGAVAGSRDGKLDDVSTEVMPDSDLKVHEDLKVDTSHGDHERFAHYVDKNDMMQAAVFGTPIKALCGKVWVPSRDPQKFPVCPECKEIYESLPPGDDGDGSE